MLPTIDILKMIAELRQEQEQIEHAILVLQRLTLGQCKRRGQPPAWMTGVKNAAPKRPGRPPRSKNKAKHAADS